MRLTPLQRIQRFKEEDRTKEKLRKTIRKAVKTWAKRNDTPIGRKMADDINKKLKILL